MPIYNPIPAIQRLRDGIKVEDEEISKPLDLTLVDHPGNPFEFKDCIFNDSPILPENPPHAHPALKFDHCTFKKPLKLTSLTFHRELTFRECRFERYVDFTKSQFFRGVSFEDCSFDEKVYFEWATFGIELKKADTETDKSTAALKQTKLECDVCHKYLEEVIKSSGMNYHPMICNPKKHDHNAKTCANFRAAVFNDGAEFDYAKFHVPVCFHKTTWHEATTFLQCQFPFVKDKASYAKDNTSEADFINFSYAQIAGSVEFNQSLRPSKKRSDTQPYDDGEVSEECIHANFQFIHVHKQHGLRFHTENLKCCSVLGTNLDFCHFSNVHWPKVETHYPLALRESIATSRSWCKEWSWKAFRRGIVLLFLAPLHAVHRVLSWLVRFPARWLVAYRSDDEGFNRPSTFIEYCESCSALEQYCIWDHKKQNEKQNQELQKDCSLKTAQEIEREVSRWRDQWALLSRAYRDLKTAYEGNKDYIYASDFHYAEKEFRRINYEVPRQIRIQLQLYWLVSGYGERVLRPIWCFLIICILGAVPYYLWGEGTEAATTCKPKINLIVDNLFDVVRALYDLIGSILGSIGWGLKLIGVPFSVLVMGLYLIYWRSLWRQGGLLLLFGLVVFGIIETFSYLFQKTPVSQCICFSEALRYSAETMGFLRPTNLDLGEGMSWLRAWSWAQALVGPFLFVMFSLALQNKLKR
ncbi:MAG: hypothetical protein OJF50_005246 [Nitrospira sp.]|jgi:hypothetical protein|nr:hypothetical protein [Nitrospira sp.]